MTEDEWLKCDDLVPILGFLGREASQRKLRLFAVACCGWVTKLSRTDTPFLHSLDVAERFADRAATTYELSDALEASSEVYQKCEEELSEAACRAVLADTARQGDDPTLTTLQRAAEIVCETSEAFVRGADFAYTARYCGKMYNHHLPDPIVWLRDIFANPFRPISLDPDWLSSTVLALATGIYEAKAFDRMPILADALQDAGCDNEDILNHCRGEGPHVRGCWVVDLVLKKV